MSSTIVSMSLLLAVGLPQPGPGSTEKPATGRPFHEINRDMRLRLKEQAIAKTRNAEACAIHQLVLLHGEICQHPKLATSKTLNTYRVKLRSRLQTIQRDIERHVARHGGPPGRSAKNTRNTQPSPLVGSSSLSTSSPTPTGKPAARAGAMIPDYGPALVELIQRTIAPGFWDVNGGPGTIVYYAPLRALVVRANGNIQGQVGGVLGGLRQAGK